MNKGLKLYLADVKDQSDRMVAISLTKHPSSGMKGKVLAMNETTVDCLFVVCPANTPIYRNDNVIGEYNVMFMPDVIKDMMVDAAQRKTPFDVEHSGIPIRGVVVVESFQIDVAKGKTDNRCPDVPDGSWVMVARLPKNLVFDGLSPEGWGLEFSDDLDWGLSVSGVFSYDEIRLSDAIRMYNELNI